MERFVSRSRLLLLVAASLTAGACTRHATEEPEAPEKEVYMVNKPVITLIDDDFSLAWVDNLHDICMDLGIRCDFALIPMKDGDSVVITDEQKAKVMAYYDEGFGFHLHPRHDDWNPETFIDLEHTRRSLTGTIDAFRAAGLPDSFCDCLVYPHGCDIKGVRAMCAEYVSYGVTVSGLYTKNLKHPYDLERLLISFASRGTKSEIKEKIRKGVEQNAWIILGTHIWQFEDEDTVDETTYSLANLREVLEYAASLADFKTFGEVIASLEEE